MASSNGVITSPVIHEKTTGDIQQVINAEGTDDLETLCKSSAVKWLSRYKPTEYTNGMINQLTSSEQRETQAKGTMVTQNGTNLRCSFGINIPFAIVPLSAFTDQGMVLTVLCKLAVLMVHICKSVLYVWFTIRVTTLLKLLSLMEEMLISMQQVVYLL